MNEELTRENLPSVTKSAANLTDIVREGERTMPTDRPLLVCKPNRVESWRVFKIMAEFIEGFDIIGRHGLSATFFGSARLPVDSPLYAQAEELGKRLSKRGFAVVTGGSTGVMQAGNKGAYEAGGTSVGLNINLPVLQVYNPYLTERFSFDHFFVRKVMLTYASEVYIYFPGGFGTLDEFFEIVTLVQTKKIRKVPIVLFGSSYWNPLIAFIKTEMYEKRKAIDQSDMELYRVVDTVDDAFEYIVGNVTC